jgi:hypothetical protein
MCAVSIRVRGDGGTSLLLRGLMRYSTRATSTESGHLKDIYAQTLLTADIKRACSNRGAPSICCGRQLANDEIDHISLN